MANKKRNKLPQNVALDSEQQKEFNKRVKQLKKQPTVVSETQGTGVVYLGHIPHGFYEKQMQGYFSQFGEIARLKIPRSRKTGNIKGYAFIKFRNDFVAKTVADSMNNYLMFHKLLKCEYVPITKLHPDTFKNCGRRFQPGLVQKIHRNRHNRDKSEKVIQKKVKDRKVKCLKKLGELGIDFEFPGLTKVNRRKANADDSVISATTEEKTESSDLNISESPLDVSESTLDASESQLNSSILDAAKSFLLEDSDEDEIEFPHTPPGARRKSLSEVKRTPKSVKPETRKANSAKVIRKSGRKRKAQASTPAAKRRK